MAASGLSSEPFPVARSRPMRAFANWAKAYFKDNPRALADYLIDCVKSDCWKSGSAEMVWQLLEETGDTTYSEDTFLKAAELLISKAD